MCLNIPSDFRWSYSKLQSFDNCPYSFKLQYLSDVTGENNAFAEYGTLCHGILEEWAKGDIPKEEMSLAYSSRYGDAVVHSFPPYPRGYADKAYLQGLEYFNGFDELGDYFGGEPYEILGVEEKFETLVGGYTLVGVVDLILRDGNGDIHIFDHKTKSMSSIEREFQDAKKQLYIYALHIMEKYGKYPKMMCFNMLKSREYIRVPFELEEFEATMRWVEQTIESIIMSFDYPVGGSPYFCQWICSVGKYCLARDSIIHSGKRK